VPICIVGTDGPVHADDGVLTYEELRLTLVTVVFAASPIANSNPSPCGTTLQDLGRPRFQYQVCVSGPSLLVACPFGRSAEATSLRGMHGRSAGSRSRRSPILLIMRATRAVEIADLEKLRFQVIGFKNWLHACRPDSSFMLIETVPGYGSLSHRRHL
jgi:hypothetical protein